MKEQGIHLRCTPEQKRLWESAAESDRRTFSDWARIILDDAANSALDTAKRPLPTKAKQKRK